MAPRERLPVSAQYSWRLVLSQTLCSKAWERQKAAGRPAFPHSCPPPCWHSVLPSQYENKFSALSLQLIFPRSRKNISLDNITYSRLCTENLAVHRSRTSSQKSVCFPESNFSLCWEQLSRTYSSSCAYISVQSKEVAARIKSTLHE